MLIRSITPWKVAARNISCVKKWNALEYTYQNSINAGSLVDRVEKMERSVNGRIGSGSLQNALFL